MLAAGNEVPAFMGMGCFCGEEVAQLPFALLLQLMMDMRAMHTFWVELLKSLA